MQLLVFTGYEQHPKILIRTLNRSKLHGALYASLHDPRGVGLLTVSENPEFFVTELQDYLRSTPFHGLQCRTELTFIGRTYAIGYESDLNETLFERPKRYVCNPAWPWAMWYPLRRAGAFEHLNAEERRTILMEHGGIGQAYGAATTPMISVWPAMVWIKTTMTLWLGCSARISIRCLPSWSACAKPSKHRAT